MAELLGNLSVRANLSFEGQSKNLTDFGQNQLQRQQMRKSKSKEKYSKSKLYSRHPSLKPMKSAKSNKSHFEYQPGIEPCIKLIQDLKLQDRRSSKQFLRQNLSLWRSFSKAVGLHWTLLTRIVNQADSFQNQFQGSQLDELEKKEVIRKVERAANQIVEMKINSAKKLDQLTRKAIQIELSQESQPPYKRADHIRVEQSVNPESM